MIFCTVGTTEFDELVRAVDALAPALDEPVIFQIGRGLYEPKHGQWFRLRPSIENLLDEASLIISHGGFGTLVEALSRGKRVVGVANPDRYDRHQEQILRRFAADGYLVACFDLEHLAEAVEQARVANFRAYSPPETRLHLEIREFLANLKPKDRIP